jgi:hypothetical protein
MGLLFGAFTPFVRFFRTHGPEARIRVERTEGERREGGGERREEEEGRETHVRATTMYFGAALHTPRGGQCPSLLRPKEGAGGREDCREQGEEKGAEGGNAHHGRAGREGKREGKSEAGRGREKGSASERREKCSRVEGTHKRGVEKNEQISNERASKRASERERERERETRQARSIPVRVSSSFSRAVSSLSLSLSLSLSPVVTLSQAISRLLFTMYRADWLFTPRAIPSTSNPRGDLLLFAYFRISRSLTLSLPPLSLSLSLSLARSISLFLLSVHETYFESARVYNKGPLRSMR